MTDKTFSQAFSANMKSMGLPVPSTLYGTIATTLGSVGALAGAIAKVGATTTLAELIVTFPIAACSTAAAAAVTEVIAVGGGLLASLYVGACIGSIIVAAYETLEVFDLIKVTSWLSEVADSLGESIDKFLEAVIAKNGQVSPIRKSITLAKK